MCLLSHLHLLSPSTSLHQLLTTSLHRLPGLATTLQPACGQRSKRESTQANYLKLNYYQHYASFIRTVQKVPFFARFYA